jgi:hypothetical protein
MQEDTSLDADATRKDICEVTVKKTWKCFVPAASMLAGSVLMIVMANKLYLLKEGHLIAALALADNKLREYRREVEDIFGEGSDAKVEDHLNKRNANESFPKTVPLDGMMWCFEPTTKQWFNATTEQILMAELTANKIFKNNDRLTINEFLSLFNGTKPVKGGDDIGWFIYDSDGSWDFNWSYYRGAPWIDIQPQICQDRAGRDYIQIAYGMHPGDAPVDEEDS